MYVFQAELIFKLGITCIMLEKHISTNFALKPRSTAFGYPPSADERKEEKVLIGDNFRNNLFSLRHQKRKINGAN
jgi:hypothetical protein